MRWNLEEAISYYAKQGAPADQSALISLLREIQRENGGSIPGHTLPAIAHAYQIKDSLLRAIISRMPSLRLANTHCLEICAGANCGKHTHLAVWAERIQKNHAGKVTVKYLPCMRMCGKGPNIRWDGELYHNADEALLRNLMEKL